MAENRERYFNGNTVYSPEIYDYPESKKYRKLQKDKKNIYKRETIKRFKNRLSIIMSIIIVCILGLFIVYRYSCIYRMEAQISSINTEISNVNYDNESMRLKLLQCSSIDYIEDSALNKLHMQLPEKNNQVILDLNKNNFKSEVKSKTSKSIIQIISEKLF